MSVQSINITTPQAKIQSFKQNQEDLSQYQEEPKGNMVKSWLVGSLIGLGLIGAYCVIKNKKKNTSMKDVKQNVEQIKEMTMDAFKTDGCKFEKGKAKLANGDNFTGTIKKTCSDNAILTLEYKNGILQKSNKIKDGNTVFEKTYTHNVSGDLRNVTNKEGKNLTIKVDNDIKTITTTNKNNITYDINEKKILSYQKNGETKKEYYYRNNDKKTLKYIKQDDKITKYDKDGKTELFTVTKADAEDLKAPLKKWLRLFDFSELKNLKPYLADSWGRYRGKIVGGTPIEAPIITIPNLNAGKEMILEGLNKLKIKKAFSETKDKHFI